MSELAGKVAAVREKGIDDLLEEGREIVRQHPATAVLLSLAAGFILGWLLRPRD